MNETIAPTTLAPQQAEPAPAAADAVLTIDLGAIRANYRRLKAELDGVACAGVVKADGYGIGAALVASALAKEGCDTFFVAQLGEGLALRRALGDAGTIHILNGIPPDAEADAAAANLVPVINSGTQLAAWRQAARRCGRRLRAAVQVDSGMSRLGLAPGEVETIAGDPSSFDGIEVTLVMSHLACADEPGHPANERQRLAFERLRHLLPPAPASLANSSGIFLGRPYHYDLARPGAALYGINPTPGKASPNPSAMRRRRCMMPRVSRSRVQWSRKRASSKRGSMDFSVAAKKSRRERSKISFSAGLDVSAWLTLCLPGPLISPAISHGAMQRARRQAGYMTRDFSEARRWPRSEIRSSGI